LLLLPFLLLLPVTFTAITYVHFPHPHCCRCCHTQLAGSTKLTMQGWTPQALPATTQLLLLPQWLAVCWVTGVLLTLAAESVK
jgi:hypothetical protein